MDKPKSVLPLLGMLLVVGAVIYMLWSQ